MAKPNKKKSSPGTGESPEKHPVEELEKQFHAVQKKLAAARKTYLTSHKDEVVAAREKLQSVQVRLAKARKKVARAAIEARSSGTTSAKHQLKKARAASLLLTASLKEARQIMVTAQSRLHAAKPFDRKLAARAKALAKFEKEWEEKMQKEAAAKAEQAKKAAARRRTTARKRAARKVATNTTGRNATASKKSSGTADT